MLTTFRTSLTSFGLLFIAAVASAEICAPRPDQWYASKDPLETRKSRVLLVTHVSRQFNSDATTIQGVQETINLLTPSSEVIYLHTGKFKSYYYPHCEPDWFYKSGGGEVKLDLEATDTIVMIGGYYSYCLGDTFIGVSKAIRKLKTKKDLKIVYVMDGAFEAIGGLQASGALDWQLEQQLTARVGLTFNYAEMAQALSQGGWQSYLLQDMLSSAFKRWPLPSEYSVTGHVRNHYWTGPDWLDWSVQKGTWRPKIDVYYLESRDLKAFFALPEKRGIPRLE